MKEEVIGKINKIGKIGSIINTIAKVIVIIGLVGCIVGTALLAFIPKGFITAKVSGDAVVDIDLNKIPVLNVIDIDDIKNAEGSNADIDIKWDINGVSYEVVDFERNNDSIIIYTEADSYVVDIGYFKWFLSPVIFFLTSSLVVIHFIGKLCKAFQVCNTPFTYEIVSAFKKLAISIIPMALLQSVTESVTNSVMRGNIDIVLGIDLMTLILIVLIFLLAAIFNYGTMLQKESDETL